MVFRFYTRGPPNIPFHAGRVLSRLAALATKKTTTKKKTRRTKAKPASRGLEAPEVVSGEEVPEAVSALAAQVAEDGGAAVATYRDPLGGHWQVLAALPLDKVAPIAFQRDLSDTHVKKLHGVIDRIDRFLDPIITVREGEQYLTPNGHHRLEAMKRIGARSILSIVVVEPELAFQILALNTEKAPNLKDRSLECIRMVRALADLGDDPESTYAVELEEPFYLTVGAAYERKARFSGSAYQSILKKVESFLDAPLSEAIATREARAARILEVDDEVARLVKALKDKGFSSPYLKTFVVARLNPVRSPKASMDFDDAMDKMMSKAEAFDLDKVDPSQISASGGYGGGDD